MEELVKTEVDQIAQELIRTVEDTIKLDQKLGTLKTMRVNLMVADQVVNKVIAHYQKGHKVRQFVTPEVWLINKGSRMIYTTTNVPGVYVRVYEDPKKERHYSMIGSNTLKSLSKDPTFPKDFITDEDK